MHFQITPEWITTLRRDIKAWDDRVEAAREARVDIGRPWNWPDTTFPLRYTTQDPEVGLGRKQRRASTGVRVGSGQHPPSEIYEYRCRAWVAMRLRIPVHVWAMLSRGLEAESIEIQQCLEPQSAEGEHIAEGVKCRLRWREWDGERHKNWKGADGEPRARVWAEWHVQRMEWVRTNGEWRGEWKWEQHEDCNEWHQSYDIWREGIHPSTIGSSASWHAIPQEVLLRMLDTIERYEPSTDVRGLSIASGVCRAWFAICAPDLYACVRVRSSRVADFIEDVSKPDSNIPEQVKRLEIFGSIPWLAISRLLRFLPRLNHFLINAYSEASHTVYHPTTPRMVRVALVASRATMVLTSLQLTNQWFLSTSDVLSLLAALPCLRSAYVTTCTFQAATTSAPGPRVQSTRLKSVTLNSKLAHQDIFISSFTQWWQWPREPATFPAVSAYPGLHWVDACSVLAVMRAIPFGMVKWTEYALVLSRVKPSSFQPNSVKLLLLDSWHTDWKVLSADIVFEHRRFMNIEFHVSCGAPKPTDEAPQAEHGARIEHIVIRMITLIPRERDHAYGTLIERMDAPILRLPRLKTVTLETSDADALADLAVKLPKVRASRTLHLRTCKAAQQDPKGQEIVSPLWHWGNMELVYPRTMWLEIIQEEEKQRKTTAVTSTADAVANATQRSVGNHPSRGLVSGLV